jgi:hypothetical protein
VDNAATFAFANPIPNGVTLGLDNSMAYSEWLGARSTSA